MIIFYILVQNVIYNITFCTKNILGKMIFCNVKLKSNNPVGSKKRQLMKNCLFRLCGKGDY